MTSRSSEAYAAFAYAYDQALGIRFARAVRKLLQQANESYPPREKTHLDVACGTGLTLEFYREEGWQTVGVDASIPMLHQARSRSPRLVAGDYRSLPLRGVFARITCLYDSLNHLKDRTELVSAFRSMRGLMDDQSLLLFDMNHPDIYPEVWGMKEPFVAQGETFHLEIATSYRKRDACGRALVTGWAELPGGDRVEIRETHEQRAYTEREIVASLGDAGLVPVDVFDFDPYHEADAIGAHIKLFFICRRK
jgi:SAM-dependent methyltransferase